jgi:hypothetical protein
MYQAMLDTIPNSSIRKQPCNGHAATAKVATKRSIPHIFARNLAPQRFVGRDLSDHSACYATPLPRRE